ncbi:MAG: glycosyltransferase family 39 protein [Candidatus Hydrogenedentes bacterium]|nr:glycosyltransferase family 39 protein [Candidatus Hydrogenedentota bacterium]
MAEETKSEERAQAVRARIAHTSWLFRTVFWLVVFLCSSFTAVAACIVWCASQFSGIEEPAGFLLRLFVKGFLFALVMLFAAGRLRRAAQTRPEPVAPTSATTSPDLVHRPAALALVLAAIALLVCPYLGTYPHLEPDEAHHLIVARNLAQYGVYGSGHPEAGFTWFDDYDSVGPPVIGPTALAIHIGEDTLISGRIVMAVFYLLLATAAYVFMRPLFGVPSAVTSILVAAASVGSVYLGRTLYGEAPALFFLLTALLFWRLSIQGHAPLSTALVSGVFFAFMILSKFFIAVAVWPMLGAIIFDRMTHRRVRAVHILAPAAMAALIVGAWFFVPSLVHPTDGGGTSGMLSMYRHNLLFGFHSVGVTLLWILREPLMLLVFLLAMTAAVPIVFHRSYDPAGIALFLLAPFIAYWWLFFTTGNIPRYLWYAIAVSAFFTGPLVWMFLRGTRTAKTPAARTACVLLAGLVLLPFLLNTYRESQGIFARDDMADENALANYVASLPSGHPIATTFYPVERSMNVLTGRYVKRVPADPTAFSSNGIVIVDSASQDMLLMNRTQERRFGRYVIVKGTG